MKNTRNRDQESGQRDRYDIVGRWNREQRVVPIGRHTMLRNVISALEEENHYHPKKNKKGNKEKETENKDELDRKYKIKRLINCIG